MIEIWVANTESLRSRDVEVEGGQNEVVGDHGRLDAERFTVAHPGGAQPLNEDDVRNNNPVRETEIGGLQ
ncbi:hypothetical protein TNCV_2534971 [Trichonephila clavipes]|nr:hypothetical protein TNCV_2534971 [Trichonephila clavipes]